MCNLSFVSVRTIEIIYVIGLNKVISHYFDQTLNESFDTKLLFKSHKMMYNNLKLLKLHTELLRKKNSDILSENVIAYIMLVWIGNGYFLIYSILPAFRVLPQYKQTTYLSSGPLL